MMWIYWNELNVTLTELGAIPQRIEFERVELVNTQRILHLKYATVCHKSICSVYASCLAYLLPVNAKALLYTPYIDSLATLVSGKVCKAQRKQDLRWEASLPNKLKDLLVTNMPNSWHKRSFRWRQCWNIP